MTDHPLLTIRNNHIDSAGMPPHFSSPLNGLTSYFENEYGEQWVFRYEDGDSATLWGGDIGWEDPIKVAIDGSTLVRASGPPAMWLVDQTIVNQPEWLWVSACCAAAAERHGNKTFSHTS